MTQQTDAVVKLDLSFAKADFRHAFMLGRVFALLGSQLHGCMQDRQLTPEQLAEQAKVPENEVYQILCGQGQLVKLKSLTAIAKALDVALSVKLTPTISELTELTTGSFPLPFDQEIKEHQMQSVKDVKARNKN